MLRDLLITTTIAAIALTACNERPKTAAEPPTTDSTTKATTQEVRHKDPVCEMAYEPSWTDYTVQGADTIHFCSETCKTAFLANPVKYSR